MTKKGATRRGKENPGENLGPPRSRVLTAYPMWFTSGSSSGLAHWWET